ncbi:MAG TPA: hypothetical protein VLN59_14285 [Burkholderiales bacterium]|nr:hypothetical protein [Burkholderiales bacterium]
MSDRRGPELSDCLRLWRHGQVCCVGPRERWDSFGFAVPHNGFVITALFHEDHPYAPPNVFLSPAPSSRHYYVHAGEPAARLCWTANGEWQPRHTLSVAVAIAMRFINEYHAGRVD